VDDRIQRQVVLPFSQLVKISFNSIRVRFFRSLITTLTLALAVAFVSFTWSGYELLNAFFPHADGTVQAGILAGGYELENGRFGAGAKDQWLVILSLLVCVVGIVNAQLMAVTERFREIGTFKCLGALDSFVVRIFVLESIYQGLFGGFVGGLAGVLIATGSFLFRAGWICLACWPPGSMLLTVAGTTLLAVVLSLLGAIYPALVAAKMQPAIALRNEE